MYPLDINDRFLYLTSLRSVNERKVHEIIGKYHIFIDIEIAITKTEILMLSLEVLRELDSLLGSCACLWSFEQSMALLVGYICSCLTV
jgi:hypothetical protein